MWTPLYIPSRDTKGFPGSLPISYFFTTLVMIRNISIMARLWPRHVLGPENVTKIKHLLII